VLRTVHAGASHGRNGPPGRGRPPDRDSNAATTVSTIVATAADTTTSGVIPG